MISKACVSTIILQFLFIGVYGQKLPKVQEVSMRAPADIKIDGKLTEWNNNLQAYNTATDLFYTLSNDNNMLYLTIRGEDIVTLFKINSSGIIFNINTTQKSDENAVSINYPFYEVGNFPYVNLNNKPKIDKTPESVRLADSMMRSINKHINNSAKFIKIIGIQGVDTLLPIYNNKGIMAAQTYDNTLTYTYEIAIPLKLLKLNLNTLPKFYYHITVPKTKPGYVEFKTEPINNKSLRITVSDRSGGTLPHNKRMDILDVTTDFWGEYTLAK